MRPSSLRYKWLLANAPPLLARVCRDEEDARTTFASELELAAQMAELLPEKINRVHYLGESFGS